MKVLSPSRSMMPLTAASSGALVYRGMRKRASVWFPTSPIFQNPAAWRGVHALDSSSGPSYEHVLADVLGAKQQHAVSFSLNRRVAHYYATSSAKRDYVKTGFVSAFRLGRIVYELHAAGAAVIYIFDDGTVWLDPRHFLGTGRSFQSSPLGFDLMRNCSRVDDEILLVSGSISPRRTSGADPTRRPGRRFRSWQKIVASAAHIVPPVNVPTVAEMEEWMEEASRRALVSVLQ